MNAGELYDYLRSMRNPTTEDYEAIYDAVIDYEDESHDFSYREYLDSFEYGDSVKEYAYDLYNQMDYDRLYELFDIDFDIEDSVEFDFFINSNIPDLALYKRDIYGDYDEAKNRDIKEMVFYILKDLKGKI